jgi:predicted outer membrane protein
VDLNLELFLQKRSDPMAMSTRKKLVALTTGLFILGLISTVAAQQVRPQLQPGRAVQQATQPGQVIQQGQAVQQGQPVQQPGRVIQQGQQGQQRTALRPIQGETSLDQQIAGWLILGNSAEVELARFAEQRASNDKVKEFAKQMVDGHTALINQLKQFAPDARTLTADERGAIRQQLAQNRNAANPANPNAPRAANPNAPQNPAQPQQTVTSQVQPGQQQQAPMGLLMLQVAERCVPAVEQELGHLKGADFDRAFIGTQTLDHAKMAAALEVLQQYASPELQGALAKALDHTQQHLTMARQICDSLKDSDSKSDRDNK